MAKFDELKFDIQHWMRNNKESLIGIGGPALAKLINSEFETKYSGTCLRGWATEIHIDARKHTKIKTKIDPCRIRDLEQTIADQGVRIAYLEELTAGKEGRIHTNNERGKKQGRQLVTFFKSLEIIYKSELGVTRPDDFLKRIKQLDTAKMKRLVKKDTETETETE